MARLYRSARFLACFDITAHLMKDGNSKVGRLLNKREAAEKLGVKVRGVECLMARKAIPFFRVSSRAVRFAESDLDAYLQRVRVNSSAAQFR